MRTIGIVLFYGAILAAISSLVSCSKDESNKIVISSPKPQTGSFKPAPVPAFTPGIYLEGTFYFDSACQSEMCAGVDFEFSEDEHRQVTLRIIGMYEGLHPDTAQKILAILSGEMQNVSQDNISLTGYLFSTTNKQRATESKSILALLQTATGWGLIRENWH